MLANVARRLLFLALLLLALVPSQGAHAALTVSTLRLVSSGTAGNGTWLQVQLPAYTASVVLEVDGAAWVDWTGASYTDGAARSSGGRATTSGETLIWPVQESATAKSIWVAGNGASRAVTVIAFGAEAR